MPQTADVAKALRRMPSVDECLRALPQQSQDKFNRNYLTAVIRTVQDGLRDAIAVGSEQPAGSREAIVQEVVRRAQERLAADGPGWRPVINATGVVIHTNLGRAMLAEDAVDAISLAARSPITLEYDLERGGRGERDRIVEDDLCALTGAQAATVVNNNAAAVLLALNTLAEGREVIVSRGELIEIGGSFRIPDVMRKSGARLREVGTTNRTHLPDYAGAIGPETALLLKVHPSNYRVIGFTAAVPIGELCRLAAEHGLDVMEDLGSGALVDLRRFGLHHEPIVKERIEAGAGLVTFSGDKLLGGPQAGIIVGRRELIERIRSNPLKRALRCDKLTLAALSATLRLYLRAADLVQSIPVLRLLTRSPQELEIVANRARELLAQRLGEDFSIAVGPSTSEIGSGAMPGGEIETRVLRITHPAHSAEAIAAMFRHADPAIIGRIAEGAFTLDMRTIEDPAVLAALFPKP
ncbi:MAG TPA: L-seryl-tRNA(Sec) selenium transferase [Candidatus Binataceae bacterium]|jgi:L-seryl-tRNA(Ser) seleniumtransferase|nr:L-seryl-tRNA(Sec) selenium transferase [Candidatus Binataceae bacterium]